MDVVVREVPLDATHVLGQVHDAGHVVQAQKVEGRQRLRPRPHHRREDLDGQDGEHVHGHAALAVALADLLRVADDDAVVHVRELAVLEKDVGDGHGEDHDARGHAAGDAPRAPAVRGVEEGHLVGQEDGIREDGGDLEHVPGAPDGAVRQQPLGHGRGAAARRLGRRVEHALGADELRELASAVEVAAEVLRDGRVLVVDGHDDVLHALPHLLAVEGAEEHRVEAVPREHERLAEGVALDGSVAPHLEEERRLAEVHALGEPREDRLADGREHLHAALLQEVHLAADVAVLDDHVLHAVNLRHERGRDGADLRRREHEEDGALDHVRHHRVLRRGHLERVRQVVHDPRVREVAAAAGERVHEVRHSRLQLRRDAHAVHVRLERLGACELLDLVRLDVGHEVGHVADDERVHRDADDDPRRHVEGLREVGGHHVAQHDDEQGRRRPVEGARVPARRAAAVRRQLCVLNLPHDPGVAEEAVRAEGGVEGNFRVEVDVALAVAAAVVQVHVGEEVEAAGGPVRHHEDLEHEHEELDDAREARVLEQAAEAAPEQRQAVQARELDQPHEGEHDTPLAASREREEVEWQRCDGVPREALPPVAREDLLRRREERALVQERKVARAEVHVHEEDQVAEPVERHDADRVVAEADPVRHVEAVVADDGHQQSVPQLARLRVRADRVAANAGVHLRQLQRRYRVPVVAVAHLVEVGGDAAVVVHLGLQRVLQRVLERAPPVGVPLVGLEDGVEREAEEVAVALGDDGGDARLRVLRQDALAEELARGQQRVDDRVVEVAHEEQAALHEEELVSFVSLPHDLLAGQEDLRREPGHEKVAHHGMALAEEGDLHEDRASDGARDVPAQRRGQLVEDGRLVEATLPGPEVVVVAENAVLQVLRKVLARHDAPQRTNLLAEVARSKLHGLDKRRQAADDRRQQERAEQYHDGNERRLDCVLRDDVAVADRRHADEREVDGAQVAGVADHVLVVEEGAPRVEGLAGEQVLLNPRVWLLVRLAADEPAGVVLHELRHEAEEAADPHADHKHRAIQVEEAADLDRQPLVPLLQVVLDDVGVLHHVHEPQRLWQTQQRGEEAQTRHAVRDRFQRQERHNLETDALCLEEVPANAVPLAHDDAVLLEEEEAVAEREVDEEDGVREGVAGAEELSLDRGR